MKIRSLKILLAAALFMPGLAGAWTADFARGPLTMHFRVTNAFDETIVLFEARATIDATQTAVTVGTPATGRIALTWEAALQRIEARLTLVRTGGSHVVVDAHAVV